MLKCGRAHLQQIGVMLPISSAEALCFAIGFFRSFQAGQSLFWVSSKFSGGIVAGNYPYAG